MMKGELFSQQFISKLLDGTKIRTSRPIKRYVPKNADFGYDMQTPAGYISCRGIFEYKFGDKYGEKFFKKKYRYGDIIYVRETFHENYDSSFTYKADGIENNGWSPSIHMPKYAARIFLQVTDVKVQNIDDITEQDAIDDGFDSRDEFLSFWYNTYPEDKWMWVYYFKRISKKEAYMNA